MGCTRCKERQQNLSAAASAAARGNFRAAGQQMQTASRTLAQDVRNGVLKQAALTRLAQLRKGR